MPDFPTDLPKFTPAVRREVRDRLRSTGLGMPSLEIAINAGEANQTPALDLIKGCAEVAHDLDDRHPPFIETVCGGKTPDWDKTKDKIAANLRRWAETAAAGGVKIAVKNHFGHVNNTPERMLWLRRTVNHPSFLLSYDYGHYQAEGLDLEATLREMIPHTSFIHVKDIVPGTKPPKYLPPGEGKIDYVKYFRLLRELNYTGPVVVEISAQIHRLPGYQPIPTAEKCHAFLRQAQQASLA
jgi:sugar phosphate isomerase/epimerase